MPPRTPALGGRSAASSTTMERSREITKPQNNQPRVNHQIRKSPVRLIGPEGAQLGIVKLEDARRQAEEAGLDLVEVGAAADPPVVRILDWGKLKYEKDKRAREAKKKAHVIEVKEVKYRPGIDTHDFDLKTQRVKRFLSQGKKVKVTIFFRYRQLRRPENGIEILDKVAEEVGELAKIESRGRLEGRRMVMVMDPADPKH